ncbi:MAG: hypothetical protein INQ03_05870 [Candidatus Heimdallarchaeota archaeon]|nr:hypothetical protein [Candidatus Heimdallarchaeota archaeon]
MDKYISHGMMYPGGNEVNVAVLAARQGLSSSYVGWLGNDLYGELILKALIEEGVNHTRCLVKEDVTTFTEIYLEQGERRFGKVQRGASTRSVLEEEDLAFIRSHDMLHTSYYSRMENFILNRPTNLMVSFDFTELADREYLSKYLPHVDIAIISAENQENIEELMHDYQEMGAKLLLVTMGSDGAYAFDGELYYAPAIDGGVVDTLGAGDSFIARFLVEYLEGQKLEDIMTLATQSAYETCQYFGAFGHGIRIPDE